MTLPVGSVLAVTAGAAATGSVVRMAQSVGGEDQSVTPIAGADLSFGPYAQTERFRIVCSAGPVAYAAVAFDPSLLTTEAEAAAAYQPLLGSDVLDLVGEGAPVDYTDGTPPATGEGLAGIGSRYTDITAGKLYLNGGTKAQPLWKIVTSA
jgi:hypothetical protein